MRIINRDGGLVPIEDSGLAVGHDLLEGMTSVSLESAKQYLDKNYDDAPFTIIGDNEIPNWVRDAEAQESLGAEE